GVDDEVGAVGQLGDLGGPADLVDRPLHVGVVGEEAADLVDPDRVEDAGRVAHGVGIRVAALDVDDSVGQGGDRVDLVAQVGLPFRERAHVGHAGGRADRVELEQIDGGPAVRRG